MPWPLDSTGWPYVHLLTVTLAIHAMLVGYVLSGTAVALVAAVRGRRGPIATAALDWLPFSLGLAITAGVAPLLFTQLIHQHSFYSSNLVLGARHMAIVPVLIASFYGLYLAKAIGTGPKLRGATLAVALLGFAFVAWSWTDVTLLMQREDDWPALYARGAYSSEDSRVWLRWAMWMAAAVPSFALIAVWQVDEVGARRRIALVALAGVTATSVLALVWREALPPLSDRSIERALPYALAHGVLRVLEGCGWAAVIAKPHARARAGVVVATAGGAGAVLTGAVLREAERAHAIEPLRSTAASAEGAWLFGIGIVVLVIAVTAIVRWVRAGRANSAG